LANVVATIRPIHESGRKKKRIVRNTTSEAIEMPVFRYKFAITYSVLVMTW